MALIPRCFKNNVAEGTSDLTAERKGVGWKRITVHLFRMSSVG